MDRSTSGRWTSPTIQRRKHQLSLESGRQLLVTWEVLMFNGSWHLSPWLRSSVRILRTTARVSASSVREKISTLWRNSAICRPLTAVCRCIGSQRAPAAPSRAGKKVATPLKWNWQPAGSLSSSSTHSTLHRAVTEPVWPHIAPDGTASGGGDSSLSLRPTASSDQRFALA